MHVCLCTSLFLDSLLSGVHKAVTQVLMCGKKKTTQKQLNTYFKDALEAQKRTSTEEFDGFSQRVLVRFFRDNSDIQHCTDISKYKYTK